MWNIFRKNRELWSECNPESDTDCLYNSQRINTLYFKVKAIEIIPSNFYDDCDSSRECKGIPACARSSNFNENQFYQELAFAIK